ncbi:MAG: CDP-alcohol phosphatidyltransferase family protein [Methylovulum miyakonense]|uniref:CDP-alcohol phosphatidyltransferase family protein n=1 Tax=Methylovulum miyakonense TaxID=645578 RepID=UPI003BB551F3
MPSIYTIKPAFQNLLRPLCKWLAGRGITANQVTVSALLLSIMTGVLLALNPTNILMFLSLPLVLLIRMALNAIDGMLAREHAMQSALGAILNELCDVASDAALYLPFALLPNVSPTLTVFIVVSAIISEMTGVIAVQIGASRRYDGPMGKSDRAFVFGAIGLAVGVGVTPGPWLNWLFAAVLALTVLTVINRARHALLEASI